MRVNATRTVVLHYHVLDGLRFFRRSRRALLECHRKFLGRSAASRQRRNRFARRRHRNSHAPLHRRLWLEFARRRCASRNASQITVKLPSNPRCDLHEGLTAVIGWDKGFVHPRSDSARFIFSLPAQQLAFCSSPSSRFGIMFWLWWTRGRDPAPPADLGAIRAARSTHARRSRHARG